MKILKEEEEEIVEDNQVGIFLIIFQLVNEYL